jgi:transcriptional regulator with XRE-family HTH domain
MLERQKYSLLRSELLNARIAAGYRQIDVAKVLQKPQSYISKIESGERAIDIIEFINYCEAIDLNPVSFLFNLIRKF